MRNSEQALVEALRNYLGQSARLGLQGDPEEPDQSHVSQQRIEGVYTEFAGNFIESPFYESVTGAFRKVHSYKYVDHPTFKASMEGELKSMGIPKTTISEAMTAIDKIVESFSKDNPSERDSGWGEQIGEIQDMTRNADNRKPASGPPFNTPAGLV